ncbi:MAG: hypothetical protein R3190_14410 [Thermoanaerobaculia bacterium]|nr:hypothetical protein [Thermoanaerobaculia bacterium]
MRSRLSLALGVLALLVGAASASADNGQGKDKGKGKGKKGGSDVEISAAVSFTFGDADIREIRAWFGDPAHVDGLPPGLAKREQLPPGLERQLVRNGTLPPGLEKKLHRLPRSLRRRIAEPPDGVRLLYRHDRVLAVHVKSSKILDIVADIVIPF